MRPQAKRNVALSVGDIKMWGGGSRQMANSRVDAVTQGLSQAVQEVTGSLRGGDIHVEQLRVQLSAGARPAEITRAFRDALVTALREKR